MSTSAESAHPSDVLARLLPSHVAAFEVRLPTEGSQGRRQREFDAGRTCAQAALRQLGIPGAVRRNSDRSPRWPPGSIGSISHCRHVSLAAAAPATGAIGIGIDVEEATAVGPELEPFVLTSAEQAMANVVDRARYASLVFSAKESAYKCWYPLTRAFLDFTDVEITLDFEHDGFQAGVIGPARGDQAWPTMQGRFAVCDDHVYTVAWIGAGPGAS